jgi:hypothetical protein
MQMTARAPVVTAHTTTSPATRKPTHTDSLFTRLEARQNGT